MGGDPGRMTNDAAYLTPRRVAVDGYPQPEIDRALRVRDMMDAYAKTGEGWDELAAEFKKVEKEFWAVRFLDGLPPQDKPDTYPR